MGISGSKRNDEPRPGESHLDFQRRVIDSYDRKNALPKMTIELPLNDSALPKALLKNVYPSSEFDGDGNITIIRKSAEKIPEFIYLEVGDVRCRFRFTGEGHMNYEEDVFTMNIEYVGFPD